MIQSSNSLLPEEKAQILSDLNKFAPLLGLFDLEANLPTERPIQEFRRGRRNLKDDNIGVLSLVEVDGILYWEEGPGVQLISGERRRGVRGISRAGEVLAQRKFEKLGSSKIADFLTEYDKVLTKPRGLRRWDSKTGKLDPIEQPANSGRILLLIHGTFSNNDKLLAELQLHEFGNQLLADAEKLYKQILTFDHPTVSVSPILNALDLSRLFASSKAEVDVICHSRGGLVTRWWLEVFDKGMRKRRAVLVGSPLGGTSLVDPQSLKSALDLLSNLGHVLGTATSLIPFMTVVSGLLRILASITSLTAKTPVVDAAIAMIPGLAAQSRTTNNFELDRLKSSLEAQSPEYFIVRGSFVPKGVGWKFWEVFADWKARLANVVADSLVFDGPNDLVVNTDSMTDIGQVGNLPKDRILSFEESPTVHHCNYFSQEETITFIARQLGIHR